MPGVAGKLGDREIENTDAKGAKDCDFRGICSRRRLPSKNVGQRAANEVAAAYLPLGEMQ